MTLGDRIKQCRQQSGLSQEKVAELIGVSRQAVTKWEAGQSAPSTENLLRLAELFGTSADLLIAPPETASRSVAEEMYRLMKAEEAQNAAARHAQRQKQLRLALLTAAIYLSIYLLGRVLWCRRSDLTVLGFLWQAQPTGRSSYLYGWLLSRHLFWISMALCVLSALWGKLRFSFTATGGFFAGLVLGMLLGPTSYGTGEYGWAFWGGVFLLSIVMGAVWEHLGRRGIPLRSRKGRIWLISFAVLLVLILLGVYGAVPDWQGIPG